MTQSQELLAWASSKIADAQQSKTYGTVTIYLEGGTITRCETKAQEKPEKQRHVMRG